MRPIASASEPAGEPVSTIVNVPSRPNCLSDINALGRDLRSPAHGNAMLPKPRERGRHAGEHLARGQVPLVFRR